MLIHEVLIKTLQEQSGGDKEAEAKLQASTEELERLRQELKTSVSVIQKTNEEKNHLEKCKNDLEQAIEVLQQV